MTEQPIPEPISPPTAPPRIWWRNEWVITATIAVVGSIFICGACASSRLMMGSLFRYTSNMMEQMDMMGGFTILDDYLIAMHYGDAERAYSYYSEEARQSISLEDVQAEIDGPRRALYQVYTGTRMDGSEPMVNTGNPGARNMSQALEGAKTKYRGTIFLYGYDDATFTITAIFEDGEWKILELDLHTPLELSPN